MLEIGTGEDPTRGPGDLGSQGSQLSTVISLIVIITKVLFLPPLESELSHPVMRQLATGGKREAKVLFGKNPQTVRSQNPRKRRTKFLGPHQPCRRRDLQLIQNHVAPSHGPPARVLSPLFFPAKSLLLPKPRGKREHPKATRPKPCGPNLAWLPYLGSNPSTNLPLRPPGSKHGHSHLNHIHETS